MKKKTVIIAVAALLVLALLLGGFPLFSRLYYGRSQAATLFAWQLKKEAFTSEYYFSEYLNEERDAQKSGYALPDDIALTVSAEEIHLADTQAFVLNAGGDRVIFYFAGGSYIDQPRGVHWIFLNALAEDTGAEIVVPIYPKLPDNDAETAYAAMTAFYEAYTKDAAGELIFMGDSAGGGLALSLAMQLRDAGLPGPDKLILICPWLDVTLSNPDIPAYEAKDPALDSMQLRHLGALWADDLAPADPVVSPLYGSFQGLGRITLITGTGELLYPDIRRMSGELAAAGIGHWYIERSGMFHVFPLYIGYNIPETEETYADIVSAVTE